MLDQDYQPNNLNTFRILFIVKGIMNLLGALFFIGYAFLGTFFMNLADTNADLEEMPFDPSILFMIIGTVGFMIALAFAIVTLLAAKYIGEKRNYTFVFVASILNCLTGVLGILLGVFAIIELNKPHVKQLFK